MTLCPTGSNAADAPPSAPSAPSFPTLPATPCPICPQRLRLLAAQNEATGPLGSRACGPAMQGGWNFGVQALRRISVVWAMRTRGITGHNWNFQTRGKRRDHCPCPFLPTGRFSSSHGGQEMVCSCGGISKPQLRQVQAAATFGNHKKGKIPKCDARLGKHRNHILGFKPESGYAEARTQFQTCMRHTGSGHCPAWESLLR